MANEPLKQLYKGIVAEDLEMAEYRSRLRLGGAPKILWPVYWVPAIAVLLIGFFLITRFWPGTELPHQDLESLSAMVAAYDSPDHLTEIAARLQNSDDIMQRLNAKMVMVLLAADGSAFPTAAEGLLEDPRADFRAQYLEYLLDYADGYVFNEGLIESRLDEETDELCIRLYQRLLNLAQNT